MQSLLPNQRSRNARVENLKKSDGKAEMNRAQIALRDMKRGSWQHKHDPLPTLPQARRCPGRQLPEWSNTNTRSRALI